MRNLLNFLARYNNLIIFLILEGISIYFLTTRNFYQNITVVNAVTSLTRGVEMRIVNTRNYFHLREISQAVADENVALKNSIDILRHKEDILYMPVSDSIYHQQYRYTSAEVISNTVNRQKNFFTINKGTSQGLAKDMAVVSDNGIAGIIVGCSKNFSVAMSLLNLDFKVSARLKSNGYFGSLGWDGKEYNYTVLTEIPQHVTFGIGDTVETTGYSAVFPEGVMIGTISGFEKTGGDFYRIRVLINTDFKKLHFVSVVSNLMKNEQIELESHYK
jgi:rod shape-determining protein MreC